MCLYLGYCIFPNFIQELATLQSFFLQHFLISTEMYCWASLEVNGHKSRFN